MIQTKLFKYILFFLFTFNTLFLQAQETNKSVIIEKNSNKEDSTIIIDSLQVNRTKGSKLEDILKYDSYDQINMMKERKTYLIKDAKVIYGDLELIADYIEIDWNTEKVYAECDVDSITKKCKRNVYFKQGTQALEYQNFVYNLKTGIGVASKIFITDGIPEGGGLIAEKVKKINDSIYYLANEKFSTDEVFKSGKSTEPDVYIQSNLAKMVKDNYMALSPPQMYIYGVPTPFILPNMIIPLTNKKASMGLVTPSFGETQELGFYLQGLGFYIPFNDYIDLKTTFDIYTQGSWSARLGSIYKKRYKYSGSLGFDYEKVLRGTLGLSDYSDQTFIKLSWIHSQDSKANPNLTLSANVNYQSAQYNTRTLDPNNYFNNNQLNNTISSSVSLTKRFEKLPITLGLSSTYSLNTASETVSLTLPTLNINMDRQYPFAPKTGSKKGFIQNTAVDYSLNAANSVNINDSLFFKAQMWRDMKTGVQQRLAISTSENVLKYFQLGFNFNFNEVWSLNNTEKFYNPTTDAVETENTKKFGAFRTFNLSTNLSTNLYNTTFFNKKNKNAAIQALRHVMTPSISYTFSPDFSTDTWGYYNYYRDGAGKLNQYSRFENGLYGSPGSGLSNTIGFGLQNNLELKVRDNKNDSIGFKKIKIFEYLNFTSGYNISAKSFNFSNINVTGSTRFFKDNIAVVYTAQFDPYKLIGTSTGGYERYDQLSSPRLVNYNVNTSYNFSNKTFEKKNKKTKDYKYIGDGSDRFDKFEYDEYGYAHFAIPWTLNVGLQHSFTRPLNTITRNTTLSLSGNIEPTPFWKIGFTGGIDLEKKKFTSPNFTITRDLRSFTMNFQWIPFGDFVTWNFYIGLKANIFKDIKYDKSNPVILNNSNFDQ